MKIIAIDGDCSANGMTDTATVKEVTPKQWKLIEQFQTVSAEAWDVLFTNDSPAKEAFKKRYESAREQCSIFGCFNNKYESRTTWSKV